MVSYYNSLTYPQKHSGYPPVQTWFSPNYHPTSNHQLLSDIETSHHQPVYYNPHHVFPQGPTMDWHNHETFTNQHHHHHHHPHAQIGHQSGGGGGGAAGASSSSSHHDLSSSSQNSGHVGGGDTTSGGNGNSIHLTDITGSEPSSSHHGDNGGNGTGNNNGGNVNNNSMIPMSPTLTKSELSSPTSNLTSLHIQISHHHQNKNHHHRTGLVKSPYYDWMKKPPYSTQNSSGKTRTKDKYRVVYTDFQRLELEKEYLTSRYITIRRKTELAQALQLSERQVKIWFQNRRAKERKQNKKRDENDSYAHSTSDSTGQIIGEPKTKLESPANLSHALHQMPMGMSSINLHHHPVLQSGHLTISPVHHSHHSPVSVQSLPM